MIKIEGMYGGVKGGGNFRRRKNAHQIDRPTGIGRLLISYYLRQDKGDVTSAEN